MFFIFLFISIVYLINYYNNIIILSIYFIYMNIYSEFKNNAVPVKIHLSALHSEGI
jgi:hypothetical protein